MKRLIDEWEQLGVNPIPWGAKLLDIGLPIKQYCALSANLSPIFLVKSKCEPLQYSRFDSVSVSKFREKNGDWSTVFELLDGHYLSEFATLCNDMRYSIQETRNELDAQQMQWQAYEDWIDFYRASRTFSIEAARGLFGELTFLKNHVSRLVGWDSAIESWQGPLGAAQDFVTPGFNAFEVKTVRASSAKVKISSENQLNFDGRLTLVIYRLMSNERATNAISLQTLIDECCQSLTASQSRALEKLIAKTGYSEDSRIAQNTLFEISEATFYDAQNASFPKIATSEVHPALSQVSYSLSIPQIATFEIETLTS